MEFSSPWLWLNLILFGLGFVVLIKGSDLFIEAAAAIARGRGISELAIGLTLVSIGTSLPELASSLYAAFKGESDFIIGNVVGSISTNITLVLGLGVVIAGGIGFARDLLRRDVMIMNAIFFLTAVMVLIFHVGMTADGTGIHGVNRFSGVVLLLIAVLYCIYLLRHPGELAAEMPESAGKIAPSSRLLRDFLLVLLGAVMVTAGSKLLVDNVVWGAAALGISTMVISATVVALGTSLPELAVTIAGVRKNHHDMAVGNIIGSCIFNVLLIIGACAVIRPIEVAWPAGVFNVIIMLGSGVLLAVLMLAGRSRLSRPAGWILLAAYAGFLIYNCRNIFS